MLIQELIRNIAYVSRRLLRLHRRRRANARRQRLVARNERVGVIDQTTLVFGRMDEPPGVRFRVAQTGVTMAEYFRDELGADVLLFMDNIFRYTGRLGGIGADGPCRRPSAYSSRRSPPTWAFSKSALPRRAKARSRRCRPSTSRPTTTDPAVATTFAHLDATTALFSRPISELGIPGGRPLASTSRILDPQIIGEERYEVARGVQEILQRYRDLQDIIAILGVEELSEQSRRRASAAHSKVLLAAVSPSNSPDDPANTSSCPRRSLRSKKFSKARSTISQRPRSSTRARTPSGWPPDAGPVQAGDAGRSRLRRRRRGLRHRGYDRRRGGNLPKHAPFFGGAETGRAARERSAGPRRRGNVTRLKLATTRVHAGVTDRITVLVNEARAFDDVVVAKARDRLERRSVRRPKRRERRSAPSRQSLISRTRNWSDPAIGRQVHRIRER